MDFARRYEASDQSIRAHQLRVNSLRLSGLPPGPAALLVAGTITVTAKGLVIGFVTKQR